MDTRVQTIIDRLGKEWIYGRKYETVFSPQHGWIMAGSCRPWTSLLINAKDLTKTVKLGVEALAEWTVLYVISSDLCVVRAAQHDHHVDVWSISENRSLISPCRIVFKYDEERKLVSVLTPDLRLQLRDFNNNVVEDFGSIPKNYKVIKDDCEYTDLIIPKRYGDSEYHVCIDRLSGREYGEPFLQIGPLYEGVRHMIRTDGTQCFVDEKNEFLFNLLPRKHPKHYSPVWSSPFDCKHGLKYYCANGKILAEAVQKNGIHLCYIMDKQGNVILPPEKFKSTRFTGMYNLGENRFAVRNRASIAIANEKGELLTDYVYRAYLNPWDDGLDYTYQYLGRFHNNRCVLYKKPKSRYYAGCIDKECNEVIPFTYSDLTNFSEGYARARL